MTADTSKRALRAIAKVCRIFFVGAVLASACAAPPPTTGSSASTSVEPVVVPPDASAALARLREAEQRRAPGMVEDDDLRSRSVEVRRAAARALARTAGAPAREKLLTLLSDADSEVVAWVAYGLGFDCADAREPTVSALVARAVSFPEAPEWDTAFTAVARAIGTCALE
ncbi:MAG: HEAT repeat domain-containing protein, partial [Myxococcales bacterium]|nr:HEAT repeat domain-containing protein [Myxococcales bacterium]